MLVRAYSEIKEGRTGMNRDRGERETYRLYRRRDEEDSSCLAWELC
jgi:hypothetical protein